jgi:hypothetical protein
MEGVTIIGSFACVVLVPQIRTSLDANIENRCQRD